MEANPGVICRLTNEMRIWGILKLQERYRVINTRHFWMRPNDGWWLMSYSCVVRRTLEIQPTTASNDDDATFRFDSIREEQIPPSRKINNCYDVWKHSALHWAFVIYAIANISALDSCQATSKRVLRTNFEHFFSPDMKRVTFFQHLAQINDRGVCSNPIGNFVLVTKLLKTTSNRCQQNPGNFKQTTQLSTFFSPTLSHPKRRSDILYPTGTSSQ